MGRLLLGKSEICLDSPDVAVLGVESGGFVVAVESCVAIPEALVGGCFYVRGDAAPVGGCLVVDGGC